MGERATKAQMIQRVDKVFQWMLDGRDSATIIELGRELWGVGEDSIEEYMTTARKTLKSLTDASKEENLRYALGNITGIVKEAREEKLHQPALQGLSQFADITGLKKLVIEMPKDESPGLDGEEAAGLLESESAMH